jgi:hypothetical protein
MAGAASPPPAIFVWSVRTKRRWQLHAEHLSGLIRVYPRKSAADDSLAWRMHLTK